MAAPLAAIVDTVVDTVLNDPILAGLILLMVLFVFLAYLFVRRTMTSLQAGYDEGRRR